MLRRAVIGCAALASALAFAATPGRACEGLACVFAERTEPASTPLELSTFMRRDAKIARGSVAQRKSKSAAPVKARKRVKVVKRSARKALVREARPALALPARVVAIGDLNNIDLGAVTSAAERASTAFAAEPPVWPTIVGDSHDIKSKAEPASPAPEAAAPTPEAVSPTPPVEFVSERAAASHSEPAAAPATTPDNWAIRVWTMLQTAFSAVVAAARWLAA
jgi:hypothetical protein